MRKIYTTAIALIGAIAFAQTPLNVNGSLENWDDSTTQADGWIMSNAQLSSGIITKITGDAQDGNVSVKLIPTESSGNNSLGMADVAVSAGQEYSVSFWYKNANTNTANRFRFWGQWRDAAGNITVTGDTFQASTYITEATTTWTKVTITSTAPAGAINMRGSIRNYSNGNDLFIDNVVFYQGSASVKDNNIAGLSIYPNPVSNGTLYVNSNNSIEKSVAIFDILGKQVANTTTSNGAVNVGSLNAGVYIVKITEEGKTATRKLVVR